MKSELDIEIDLLVKNIKKMENIELYDLINLIKSYNYQLLSLQYFYENINNKNILSKQQKIKKHTLMYVNLGRGFPKEFMDGHWCYIVKIMGSSKALIIPASSIKENDKLGFFQTIIKSYNPKTHKMIFSKLKFSDIRTIDIHRIYYSKGMYYVQTPRKNILDHLYQIIGDQMEDENG